MPLKPVWTEPARLPTLGTQILASSGTAMPSSVVRSLRVSALTLAVALVASLSPAATVAVAQTGRGPARASQPAAPRSDSIAARTAPASCEGAGCEQSGTGFSGMVRRLQIALRNVGRGTNATAQGAFDIPLRFSDLDRFGPLGKLLGTLALFAMGLWAIMNPKSVLVVALWACGFWLVRFGQVRGHFVVGVAAACAYWWLLHFLGGRASRRWGRRRLRPTVYKPS
jgi:hypothetical protein